MATSAPNPTPDPRPTGDLEHLFRQKFAEAEVTPRASLWEQLDHELLVEQNNTYRRRLTVHRWVAAACLLFLLSIGGWALLHEWQTPAGAGLATRRAARGSNAATPGSQPALASTAAGATTAAASAAPETTEGASLPATTTPANSADQLLAAVNSNASTSPVADGSLPTSEYVGAEPYEQAPATRAYNAGRRSTAMGTITDPGFADSRYATGGAGLVPSPFSSNYPTTENSSAMAGWNSMVPRFAGLRGGWLGSRPDTLKASLLAAPQPAIGTLAAAQDQTPPTKLWRRLRLGGSYAAASYNPNVDFSQTNSPGLAFEANADAVGSALRSYYQEDAETEYRRNLRAGVSQRVAFTAAYALNKRLMLTSGVEASQQTATSATSYSFLDGQQVSQGVAALFSNSAYNNGFSVAAPAAIRKASYRYRTVAVPVQVRYGAQRTGASLYAKVGAAVGLLLSTKSELQSYSGANRNISASASLVPETTRRYSLSSNDSPYRKVQASVRGGAGVRYQPANATWNLVLGPTAELGLTSLNANPGQGLLNQRRPYSVGMEANVEFNSHKPATPAP